MPLPPPVLMAELGNVDPDRLAVLDPPFALDHHPVGGVRAAEDERGERVVAPEKRSSSSV